MTVDTCPTCNETAIEGTRYTCTNGHTWTTAQWLATHSKVRDLRPRAETSEVHRIRRCTGCGRIMGGEPGSYCGRCITGLKTGEPTTALAARE